MRIITFCLLALMFSMHINLVLGQCINNEGVAIGDNSNQTLVFGVNGLADDDLSAGTNNICRVDLQFTHEYIGDLVITLTSPDGDVVTLIGAPTTAIGPTNTSSWNISLISCDSTPAPDPGFSNNFNNDQAWGILGNYQGSYFPNSGCFSDFDSGSANGNWILTVSDVDAPATGNLVSASIFFCNDSGLECFTCEADAGSFNVLNTSICEGSNIDLGLLTPIYPGSMPDAGLYSYLFLISANDTILIESQEPETSELPAGNYSICGLSYLASQFPYVNSLLDTALVSDVIQALVDQEFCGDLTSQCIPLTILEPSIPEIVERNICPGDTVFFEDQFFTRNGTFPVIINSNSVCDSIVNIRVVVNPISAQIAEPDTISCAGSSIQLNGSGSIISANPNFMWTTQFGSIASNPTRDSIRVVSPAEYTLIVNDGICFDTASVIVIGDLSYPQVFTEGGELNCDSTRLQLRADAFPLDVSYAWRLNGGGVISDQQDLNVTVPGLYTIQVTNAQGCSSFAEAEVTIDTIIPTILITEIGKNCITPGTTIRTIPQGVGASYLWTFPDNSNRNSIAITTNQSGYHSIVVTSANGCMNEDSIQVSGDYVIPNIVASVSDSIFCGLEGAMLSSNANIPISMYTWTGPQGFSDINQNVTIFSPGEYIIEMVSENNCTARDSVSVFASENIFDFVLQVDSITCSKDSATIKIESASNLQFNWLDLPNTPTNQDSAFATEAGLYQIVLLDTMSGCTQVAEANIIFDNQLPVWSWIRDTISCTDSIADISFNMLSNRPMEDYFWTLPEGTFSNDSLITVDTPGVYRLTVILENGCSRSSDLNVISEVINPIVFPTIGNLGCFDSIPVSLLEIDPIDTYEWTGPNNFMSSFPDPHVQDTGVHQLRVTDENGCTNLISIVVEADTTSPVIMSTAEELTCIDTVVSLVLTPVDSAFSYEWFYQNSIIGSDSLIEVEDIGEYIGIAYAENNCSTSDTFQVVTPAEPDIQLQGDTITCFDPNILFSASSNTSNVNFAWFDISGSLLSSSNSLMISDGDEYNLTATGVNGCVRDTSFIAVLDTVSPIALIEPLNEILCMQRIVDLSGEMSMSADPISYNWSVITGIILSGASSPIAVVEDAGIYGLEVQNTVNGCIDYEEVEIFESTNSITSAYISIVPPACIGDGNASIILDSITGGTGALSIFQNGSIMAEDSIIPMLSAGTYNISIVDVIGCTFDTIIVIDETSEVSVELGPDRDIFIGDTVHANAVIDFDPSRVVSVVWSGGDSSCTTCLDNILMPLSTTTFTVMVENDLGCIIEDQMTIYVREQGNFFVPNVFTPNGDNVNDRITFLATNSIERVLEFGIFNRYGNQVFGARDFIPESSPEFYWDGSLEGEPLNPGVFTWYAVYELLSSTGEQGRIEKKSGSITLLR